jgi:chromatin remodeling complex protein RSC6
MDAMLCLRFMSRKFLNLAHQAANFPECTMLVDSTLDILGKQIKAKINACINNSVDAPTISADASPPNDLLSNARLKQKEVQVKSSKQKRTWLDKKHKSRKKRQNKATSHEKKNQRYNVKKYIFSILFSPLFFSETFGFLSS